MANAMVVAAAVQALAAGVIAVFTVPIRGVYKRQREIMAEQQRLSELLATAEFAPLLLPEWSESHPLRVLPDKGMPLKNMGRGCAFEIRVTSRYVGAKGKRPLYELQIDAEFLESGGGTRLRSHFTQPPRPGTQPGEGEIGVAVIHYKDFCGDAWHTSWNIDPRTGQPIELRAPAVWNEAKWQEYPHLVEFCKYCAEEAHG